MLVVPELGWRWLLALSAIPVLLAAAGLAVSRERKINIRKRIVVTNDMNVVFGFQFVHCVIVVFTIVC